MSAPQTDQIKRAYSSALSRWRGILSQTTLPAPAVKTPSPEAAASPSLPPFVVQDYLRELRGQGG